MRKLMIGVGVLMMLTGVVWLMQGAGLMKGSPMTGQVFWLVMGLVCMVGGIRVSFFGIRRKPATPPTPTA